MQDDTSAVFRLVHDYPLYRFRTRAGEGYVLSVLLLGGGPELDRMFRFFLTQGQLPDTRLELTVLTPGAGKSCARLVPELPDLEDGSRAIGLASYCTVLADGKPVCSAAAGEVFPGYDCSYAYIRFESVALSDAAAVRKALLRHRDARYVVCCPERGRQQLAQACGDHLRPERGAVLAYLPARTAAPVTPASPRVTAVPLEKKAGFEQLRDGDLTLRQLAWNLHFIYCCTSDANMPAAEIRKSCEVSYNDRSNFEAAIHAKEKLGCCGIELTAPRAAAVKLAERLERDPAMVRRLAAVEHRRWLMDMAAQGYMQMPSLDAIYRDGNDTKCKGRHGERKWHCCMLPCRMDGSSRLTRQDFAEGAPTGHLDPLDRMSVEVHRQCFRVWERNRDEAEAIWKELSMETRLQNPEENEAMEQSMAAIRAMEQQKPSAVSVFEQALRCLRTACGEDEKALGQLARLRQLAAPLMEFAADKDYKYYDLAVVQQLPMALVRRSGQALLVTMPVSGLRNIELVRSARLLLPERLRYAALCESEAELGAVLRAWDILRRWLDRAQLSGQPAELMVLTTRADLAPEGGVLPERVRLRRCGAGGDGLKQGVSALLRGMDTMDLTEAPPKLFAALWDATAEGELSAFAANAGGLYSLRRAEGLQLLRHSGMTIDDLFALDGTKVASVHSREMSDMTRVYQDIYEVTRSEAWADLRRRGVQARESVADQFDADGLVPADDGPWSGQQLATAKKLRLPVQRFLLQAARLGLVSNVAVDTEDGNVSFRFRAAKGSERFWRKLEGKLKADMEEPSIRLFRDKENRARCRISDVLLRTRVVDGRAAIPLRDGKRGTEDVDDLISLLRERGLIRKYRTDGDQVIYRTCCTELLLMLDTKQTAGDALEYWIYYTLLDNGFTDVEHSRSFWHTVRGLELKNELDVLAVWEGVPFFISAKDRSEENMTRGLTHTLREIRTLAEQFGGTQARAVLAAPQVEELNARGGPAPFVGRAYGQGVCFAGRIITESGHLADYLKLAALRELPLEEYVRLLQAWKAERDAKK